MQINILISIISIKSLFLVLASDTWSLLVSASDTWFLLGFIFQFLGFVLGFDSWIFDGLGFQIIDFEWVLASISTSVSASVLGLWIGFGFCPQAFNRFQLPIVFGIQDMCGDQFF
ncbi:hypothetical protein RhiirA5_421003 [Rhizophagus irregularis]|uniref:Uncharacterized protein n=1 Tax=Rhizophagus irregularis TaxID=588596 RepID=A0A2N0PEX4_9GLOM|nr:hypothetical protein RhiirA5_421003 [Rhizophagus irregularis]